MRKKAKLGWEEPFALLVQQVVHPYVVLSDVAVGFRAHLRDLKIHFGWDSFGESLRQPGFGPLPPRPLLSLHEALLKRGKGKVEQHRECKLVVEEIIQHVGRGIVTRQNFVEGIDRSEVEIRTHAEIAVDLEQVAVE